MRGAHISDRGYDLGQILDTPMPTDELKNGVQANEYHVVSGIWMLNLKNMQFSLGPRG